MIASPCILRSAQCAALIALAAAAGIVRAEASVSSPGEPARRDSSLTQSWSGLSPLVLTHFTAKATSPWLRQFAAFAVWCLNADRSTAAASVAPEAAADADASAPHAFPSNPPTPMLALPPPAEAAPVRVESAPRPALCARPHLIPFAVGPPAHESTFPPLAAGTRVPGDSTAHGILTRSVFRVAPADEVSSMARLARRFDPRAVSAGSLKPDSAIKDSVARSRRLPAGRAAPSVSVALPCVTLVRYSAPGSAGSFARPSDFPTATFLPTADSHET